MNAVPAEPISLQNPLSLTHPNSTAGVVHANPIGATNACPAQGWLRQGLAAACLLTEQGLELLLLTALSNRMKGLLHVKPQIETRLREV